MAAKVNVGMKTQLFRNDLPTGKKRPNKWQPV